MRTEKMRILKEEIFIIEGYDCGELIDGLLLNDCINLNIKYKQQFFTIQILVVFLFKNKFYR